MNIPPKGEHLVRALLDISAAEIRSSTYQVRTDLRDRVQRTRGLITASREAIKSADAVLRSEDL